MTTQYRHFQNYKGSSISKFIKVLRLKPSLTETLKTLVIDAVDPMPYHQNHFRPSLMKFLNRENVLESLSLRTVFDQTLLDDIFLYIAQGSSCSIFAKSGGLYF